MPRLSEFLGMKIYLYVDDHRSPHVHVIHAGEQGVFDLDEMRITEGDPGLNRTQRRALRRWAERYESRLWELWEEAENRRPVKVNLPY